ncbi:uncharacterized protein LOC107044029 [Diachasma alloeum]|uniref:uncharacterized protein LOC107044029 n=1 Tax=Diachasma alloeum TaxID=454923 RepID=UPI0007384B9A|nr:uncharacterized protein LOC107044029 [Diachasma alloeum]
MKMEVVVSSSGRFGDHDTPFKNEEIREWSGVDQITGMLEQARIETGQWRAFNNGSAHSYGKMVDSRQRNNVDGTVIQKARRQVEVLQSQEPGRRVQVVRASYWSSSRVTDNQGPPSFLHKLEKYPFLKRSTSEDDLSLFPLENPPKSPTPSFTRASKLRRSLQIPTHRSKISLPASTLQKSPLSPKKLLENHYILENSKKSLENRCPKNSPKLCENHYSSINSQKSLETHFSSENSVENHYIPISSTITLKDPMKSEISIKNSSLKSQRSSHLSPKFPRSQGSPSKPQRSQVTVVNLINPPKTSIVTLGSSGTPGIPAISLSKKKVGFCKTEIHFAADSGKVNIVETDGKPPPTNKFRRRRKTQTFSPNLLKNKDGDLGISGDTEKKVWINSDLNPKIHTTTICLGDAGIGGAVDKVDFRTRGDLKSPKAVSEIISRRNLANFVSRDSEDNKVLSTVVTTHESTIARVEENISSGKSHVISDKESLDGAEDKKIDETEKSVESDEVQQKSGGTATKIVETDMVAPLYVNVFGRVRDAFPVYENYRVGGEKKQKSEMKRPKEKERVLKKNKAISPNNGVKRYPFAKRGSQGSGSTGGRSQRDVVKVKSIKRPISGDGTIRTKKQPMEVVYRTAVYNMKNEKLAKPSPPKAKSGPRLLNDLICGGKPKKNTNSSKRKTSSSSQGVKGSSQLTRHWK